MDDAWSSGAGGDGWSGSATTVDYGNNIGRSYSNNTTLTGGDPASTPSTSGGFSGTGTGGGGGGSGGGGGGGYSRNLNPKAQLSIDRMPYETSVETIRNIFGRYGRVARVICDYKITEERLNVWLDYEDERVCEAALRENGRKMEKSTIVVMKSSTGGGDDSFRSRAPKKDAWGNNTWNKGDRSSSGGGGSGGSGGQGNTSTASIEGADWGADWTSGGGSGGDNASSFDTFGDGEERRSSRGRGRGGRDRGGRGGGRGRGGGGRYQPYDKNDSFGEKADLPPWEDIIAGKSSSTATPPASTSASASDWNSDDWGSGGGGGGGGGGGKEPSQQTTAPPAESFVGWD